MNFIKTYRLEIFIFALALAARLVYLGASIDAWGGDLNQAIEGADYYFVLSQNILDGNGFSSHTSPPYPINSFRTPVMPYFLVAAHELFGGYGGAILFQIFLASLLPLLAMRLAGQIDSRRWIALTVGFFLALEPYSVLFSTIFYSETVFTFLFFVTLIYFFKYLQDRRLFNLLVSGSFLSFSMLTKPTVEFLPLFLGLLLLWVWRTDLKREFIRVLLFVAVCAAIASPWIYRNYVVTGSPGLSPQTGVSLYVVLWPSVLAIKNDTSWGTEFSKLIDSGVSGPNDATVKQSAEYAKLAVPLLLQNPVPLMLVCANTALGFFTHDGVYDVLRHLKIKPDRGLGGPALFVALKDPGKLMGMVGYFIKTPFVLIMIGRVFWVLLTALSFYGVWRYMMRERKATGIAAVIVVAYFVLTTLVIGLSVNARYRLPVTVFIVTFACIGAAPLAARVRSHLL